ncbi:hypothetical protein HBO12_03415 [Pseudomonas sp. WS 5059]|uniref:hypothetical protein n=1 Tax=unclassified Pseudomonas TaxID=196821 RepID=UPI0014752EDC|nr:MULTISPECIES: hypothetical protein [unclassified Pseudomonas]NMX60278.1 hypothetical protein [Pseudomonas sp. WS 5079]NMY01986.1 hypothetical protein [Pseudomonas sp. WS 5059]NMY26171.1 hypothetical protein [Pseudomonas sp. WS 5021]
MTSTQVIVLLKEIGLPPELLASAAGDWRLRTDLGLSSAETLELQLMLEQLGCGGFSLWDTHDHTLRELERLIESAHATDGPRAGGTK